jgi:hypothetical protein
MSYLFNQENDIENNLQEMEVTDNVNIYNRSTGYYNIQNSFMFNLLRRLLVPSPTTIENEYLNEPTTPVVVVEPTPLMVFAEQFYVQEEDEVCCICLERREIDDICRLNCQHDFCIYCTYEHIQRNTTCPVCRLAIVTIQTQSVETKQLFHGSDA